jgi:VIT1/CCC1 family predicted Fe2+/Mn2+ transporter
MGELFVRGRRLRLLDKFRTAADKATAVGMVREELDEQLTPITTVEDRNQLYERIYDALKNAPAARITVDAVDLKGAFGVFLLVSLTTIPAVIPFLFIDDPWRALRVSNAALIALIFFVGYRWGGYTQANPWMVGLGFMLVGVVLVAIAIALGG